MFLILVSRRLVFHHIRLSTTCDWTRQHLHSPIKCSALAVIMKPKGLQQCKLCTVAEGPMPANLTSPYRYSHFSTRPVGSIDFGTSGRLLHRTQTSSLCPATTAWTLDGFAAELLLVSELCRERVSGAEWLFTNLTIAAGHSHCTAASVPRYSVQTLAQHNTTTSTRFPPVFHTRLTEKEESGKAGTNPGQKVKPF